jgi:UDP-N-acetylmuramyl pentapeptide phosphotransferase/UDP-N-acetylglucosamine-1-phosphate transferase
MPELQGVGDDQAAAQLCRGLNPVPDAGLVACTLWAALFCAVGYLGTWLAMQYAVRHRLIDEPGERRSHTVATPRGGGIGIVVALLMASVWLLLRNPQHARLLLSFAIGLALVAGIGWADDHRPRSPWSRLAVQAVAALLLGWGIWQEGGSALAAAAAFMAAMVLVNVWNFMDGIDGLAASQTAIAALAFGVAAGQGMVTSLAFALAAACLGFLPFNLPRARIFLGDVGSGALGYALAALAIWLAMQDWEHAPGLLLPVSAFLIDATLTLAMRIVRRQAWWLPHTEHGYQHWVRRCGRHGRVTLAYAGWGVVASGLMLIGRTTAPTFMMVALLTTYLAGWVLWIWLRRPLSDAAV